jgi:hypothetical protein
MNGLHGRVVLSIWSLLLTALSASWVIAQEAPPPAPEQNAQSSSRWPLRLEAPEGLITIYQPQLTSFDGNQLKARAAVSVLAPGQQDPTFGALWMESRVSTDRVARTVQILEVTVTHVRFPGPGGVSEQALTNALRGYNAQQGSVTLSLDQLLSMLQVIQKEQQAVKDIATAPPQIIFVNHPAVLVQYDGQPKLVQVENSNLIRAVNTPYFVVLDPPSRTYFLKGAALWYAAPNPTGPFQSAGQVPPTVAALAASTGYQDPQAPLQGVAAQAIEVITATEPSELVWTDGPEEMATIPGTELLYVTNTPSDLFLLIDTQQIFVLLSGRWYTAPNHNGPWAYVPPDKLPPDFARIPPNSEKGSVLAHVAGTAQARDAVADAFVPQTAAIDRHNFEQPPVQYDGDPSFQPIQNSPVAYATNTPNSVLTLGGRYYCCYNAVWYLGGAPVGPWEICTSVPVEIYTIPPTCPVYSVRYCYVYESTPDLVYVGYTPGYTGCYPYDHVVVFGTGYHYSPWVGRTYYSRPWTFGFAARYDGYSGHWGFSVGDVRGGGFAWFGSHESHEGGDWFGHGGYHPIVVHNDVHITNIRETNINVHRTEIRNDSMNLYERRKDVRRDLPARTEFNRPAQHGENAHAAPGRIAPRAEERNNVFASPNGDVYRKTFDGWEQRDNGKWVSHGGGQAPAGEPRREAPVREAPVHQAPARGAPAHEPPAHQAPVREAPARQAPIREAPAHEAPPPELNQDYRARVAGQQRAHNYQPPAQQAPREAPARNERPAPQAPREAPARNERPAPQDPRGGPRNGPGNPQGH